MSAVYLGPDGYARYYEDNRTGPQDTGRVAGLTRVDFPEHVTRVWPCDIADMEKRSACAGEHAWGCDDSMCHKEEFGMQRLTRYQP